MLTISILILTIQSIFRVINTRVFWQVNKVFDTAIVLVCLVILVGAYTATALKLYAQRRAIRLRTQHTNDVAPNTISEAIDAVENAQEHATPEQQPAPTPAPAGKKRAMHIQALKIYTAIFLVFLITNSLAVLLGVLNRRYFVYIYTMKHLANPVIYYCFVEKFRQSVKKNWRRLNGR